MRKSLWIAPILLLFGGIGAPGILRADDITYNMNLTVGTGFATGTITTDGTIGTLAARDILGWNLLVNDGTSTVNISSTGITPVTNLFGVDLTATPTAILFDFEGADGGQFTLSDATCSLTTCAVVAFEHGGLYVEGPTGAIAFASPPFNDVIATTPEPGTAVLLLTGIGLTLMIGDRRNVPLFI
jgi:hypothetical protein